MVSSHKKATAYYFKTHLDTTKNGGALTYVKADSQKKEEIKKEKVLLCRQCSRVITRRSLKAYIDGAHEHTFANPHGIVFEIGCFKSAAGCIYAGQPTGEFSWFKGFMWQIAVCGSCLSHVGWLFTSGSNSFAGLILDRLIESS